MKTKRIVLLTSVVLLSAIAAAATAQQAPRVTSSVQSGIGVVMPAQPAPQENQEFIGTILPGSRGNEGGTTAIYPNPDMPVSSDGVVGMPMDVPLCQNDGNDIAPGGCVVPEPGVVGGGYPGMPMEEPGYDPTMSQHPPIQVETPVCGHQELVGKKITDVDLKSFKGPVRVVYPNSPMTMDYSADRINLIVEDGTDFILQVTCG